MIQYHRFSSLLSYPAMRNRYFRIVNLPINRFPTRFPMRKHSSERDHSLSLSPSPLTKCIKTLETSFQVIKRKRVSNWLLSYRRIDKIGREEKAGSRMARSRQSFPAVSRGRNAEGDNRRRYLIALRYAAISYLDDSNLVERVLVARGPSGRGTRLCGLCPSGYEVRWTEVCEEIESAGGRATFL